MADVNILTDKTVYFLNRSIQNCSAKARVCLLLCKSICFTCHVSVYASGGWHGKNLDPTVS